MQQEHKVKGSRIEKDATQQKFYDSKHAELKHGQKNVHLSSRVAAFFHSQIIQHKANLLTKASTNYTLFPYRVDLVH